MYELPNDRKNVIISEIKQFVSKIIEHEIQIEHINFGKLRSDIYRFPDYESIENYVTKAEKTEEFYKRLKHSAEQMKQYFHETFRNTYKGKTLSLAMSSDSTVEFLDHVLPELGVTATYDKVKFPALSVDYEETADHELMPFSDDLIDRILKLADKIYKFIRANNIYGRAYKINIEPYNFKGRIEDVDWKAVIEERISACDKVIAKKYVVDLFEDGSSELTTMLKVTWDAVFVLMSAPLKKRSYIYRFINADGITEDSPMKEENCIEKLNSIYLSRFKSVIEIISADDFLTDKTEKELFDLYNKMLDLDEYHYMTGTKGDFVAGENEQKLNDLIGLER